MSLILSSYLNDNDNPQCTDESSREAPLAGSYCRSKQTKSTAVLEKQHTMRRRKNDTGNPPSSDKNEEPEFLDEQEQEKMIQTYREEAEEQQKLIEGVFSRVCEGAMALSVILGLSRPDWICWMHVALACGLHWSAKRAVTTRDATTKLPFLVVLMVLGLVLTQYLLEKSGPAAEVHHYETINPHVGLAVSNLLTMGAASYLQSDEQDTKKALNELESVKYRYKSL